MTLSLNTQSQRLQDWLCQKALPFWANTAIDAEGGWYEDLTPKGTPDINKIRRLRVQARQIYVYSLAHKMGWFRNEPLIDNAFNFLMKRGYERGSRDGFIHLLRPDYAIEDERRDFYDHTFHLLACGWTYNAVESQAALTLANKIADFIDEKLASKHGGWLESIPDTLPRRQNPHMHFFEASMALHDITGESRWMDYARQIFRLFETRFFDPNYNIVREYFEDDLAPIFNAEQESVEPGHAAEWVWLLKQYEDRTDIDTSHYAQKLYERLVESDPLFLNDEEYIDGTPKRDTKRLWVQTEFIKAHIAQSTRGLKGTETKAAEAIHKLFEIYLQSNGTWVDQIDKDGLPISATIPTSTFYHIICMAHEVQKTVARA